MARLRYLVFVAFIFALLAGRATLAQAQSPAVLVVGGARPCARISLGSDEPAIVVPIERALRATPAFARGEFMLTDTPGGADVVIFVRSARLLPQAVLTYNLRADGPRPYALLQNTSWSDVTRPQNLAGEIVQTLHRACSGEQSTAASAPDSPSPSSGAGVSGESSAEQTAEQTARRSLALPSPLTAAERAERIRALRTVRVVVHSSQMEAKDVRAALAQDAALRARNVTTVLGAADATLEIRHEDPASPLWKFAVIDSRSPDSPKNGARNGALLTAGRVFALHGNHAAPMVAAHLARLLAPRAPTNARTLAVRAALEQLGRQPEWKAQLASMTYGGASGGDALALTVENDRLAAYSRDTGRRIFSIALDDIEDLDFNHEWHAPLAEAWMALLEPETMDATDFGGDPRSAAAGAAFVVGWAGVGAALSVVRTRQHFLTIAWRENDDEPKVEVVALQVPGKEMKSLKAALAPLTVTVARK